MSRQNLYHMIGLAFTLEHMLATDGLTANRPTMAAGRLGIEGDVSFTDLSDTVDPAGFDVEQDVDMLASIRGRIGFAFDRFLPYVTAGWGFADAERTTEAGGGESDSQLHDGLVYGGGIEYAVTDALSMRAEYLHYDLGEESYDLGLPFDPEIDLDVDVFRIGVNFNF